ncbi:hypothetical protein JIN77_09290 [Verrucomicrobiaceae bacterium R5-34]|uniref:Uncharacterized protein n=1 Tax=Oceaniferula flava TaxID=2800421 RepID=A0AAE2V9V2_9BACT|nr:hypothetical protein [Oceaniferula flavus]MBK1830917.1 hypothetical protein [Verrucomicrobiaceae bacterium R5-34]MBK1855763.1 hypothetical protein [Oceaniferula flavus]MBM1137070.1 hypothetical protein [Oceaniferula flavus]
MSNRLPKPHDYIPEPCQENWHSMSGDEKMRHCEKCCTHVHNLTGMSAQQIAALRVDHGGKLCGAFRIGSGMAKPLALGSGIASLALASCSDPEPPLVGMVPPISEQGQEDDHATPPPHTDHEMVAGMICPATPEDD